MLSVGIILGLPVIIPVLLISQKRRKTFLSRLGLTTPPNSDYGKNNSTGMNPIWVHALSVGEVRASVPLIVELRKRYKGRFLLLTVTTQTGFESAERLLREDVDGILYFPYDLYFSVKYVTEKINPSVVMILESEIWPNFLAVMNKRKIPVVLVNARLSDRSFSRYKRFSFVAKSLFSLFSAICTQSERDGLRFNRLGVPPGKIHLTGNVKFDRSDASISTEKRSRLKRNLKVLSGQKILVAGSTHKGEEAVILEAFSRLRAKHPQAKMILAPRNPARADVLGRSVRSAGLSPTILRCSDLRVDTDNWDVVIVGAIGLLNRLYAICDVAFVGGSLVKAGGHNPLEAAAFSKPILFGPDMSDFKSMSELLLRLGGAIRVRTAEDIYREVDGLLNRQDESKRMGEKAFHLFNDNKGAVERTLAVVHPYIQPAPKNRVETVNTETA